MSISRRFELAALLLALLACAPLNRAVSERPPAEPTYDWRGLPDDPDNSDSMFIALALSGGGTRAAALAYGVLEEMSKTTVPWEGRERKLSQEVDLLSSVSGGSFTASAFALWGDAIFDPDHGWRPRFLDRNIDLAIAGQTVLDMFRFLSPDFGRIDAAAELYDRSLFDRSTFGSLAQRRKKPFIVLNATNMSLGVTLHFTQEDFDALGSDLNSFPIARGVAASSAFPYLLSPLTLKNYGPDHVPSWVTDNLHAESVHRDAYLCAKAWLETSDVDRHPYLHLLDGGLADNIGARYLMRSLAERGWIHEGLGRRPDDPRRIRKLLLVTVNARGAPNIAMDKSRAAPGFLDMLYQTSSVAMDNFTDDSIEGLTSAVSGYREALLETIPLGTGCRPDDPLCDTCYFPIPEADLEMFVVNVDLDQVHDPALREAVLAAPTDFHLSQEQVGQVIRAGHLLLAGNPCFRRFLDRVRWDARQREWQP